MSSRYRVIICRGPECGERRGSEALRAAFAAEAVRQDLAEQVDLEWQSCFGRCSQGPNVLVRAEISRGHMVTVAASPIGARANAALYSSVAERDIARIVREHVGCGRIVNELVTRLISPARTATTAAANVAGTTAGTAAGNAGKPEGGSSR